MTAIAANLKQLRKMRGISQEKLAEAAELHPNYIRRLERGLHAPSLDTIHKLAAALKVKPYELLK